MEVVPIYRRSARVVRAVANPWSSGRCPVRFRRLVAGVGGIVYDRDSGGPYRVRVVDVDVLAGRGVGWLPWAAADSSRRLYPEGLVSYGPGHLCGVVGLVGVVR